MLSERYIELNSMIYDLFPYIPYLNVEDKGIIVSKLEEIVNQ